MGTNNEFEIEIGREDRNINLFCDPMDACLRGMWRNASIVGLPQQTLAAMPNLPGMRVIVNFKDRYVRVHDPLAKDAAKMAKYNAIVKAWGEAPGAPVPELMLEDLEPPRIAWWTWWAAKAATEGNARGVRGQIPDYKAVPVQFTRRGDVVGVHTLEEEPEPPPAVDGPKQAA